MQPFTYAAQAARVIFGSGTLDRAAGGDRCARARSTCMVLATPQQRAEAEALGRPHRPARRGRVQRGAYAHACRGDGEALRQVASDGIDGLVAVGGGSTIGLAKAIALRTDLPQIVVPTTYAGSEMTPILGETEGGVKTTQKSPKVLPGGRDLRRRPHPVAAGRRCRRSAASTRSPTRSRRSTPRTATRSSR